MSISPSSWWRRAFFLCHGCFSHAHKDREGAEGLLVLDCISKMSAVCVCNGYDMSAIHHASNQPGEASKEEGRKINVALLAGEAASQG